MKKFLSILLVLVCVVALPVVSLAGAWSTTSVLTYTVSNVNSVGARIPTGSTAVTILVPTLESTTLRFQVAATSNGTYYDFYYLAGAAAAPALYVTGATTGAYVIDLPEDVTAWQFIRLVCGTGQTANRTFTIKGR
jgi:hypothetical protein